LAAANGCSDEAMRAFRRCKRLGDALAEGLAEGYSLLRCIIGPCDATAYAGLETSDRGTKARYIRFDQG
jgi:hypothetical protein